MKSKDVGWGANPVRNWDKTLLKIIFETPDQSRLNEWLKILWKNTKTNFSPKWEIQPKPLIQPTQDIGQVFNNF